MPKPVVYFGSPRQTRLEASETLPAKLDLILERLNLRERVKDELVVIKMHTGNNIGYSTLHPVFVRKVVKAIKDGGGKPFVADVSWDVQGAEERGYSAEVLGCPVYPAAGPKDRYFYAHNHPFKNIQGWKVAGLIEEASFLVNFAHAKGHPSCSYGGAFKNLALGCMIGETRSAMHDACQFDRYWFAEQCPDPAIRQQIIAACPHAAIVQDKHDENELHLHPEMCNQCGRCLKVAPAGCLRIDPVNFHAFQEACAISTAISLSTFEAGKATHIVLANQITPVCDCFGFTGMSVMNDAGIFGSDDIVAVDRAVLDATADCPLYAENLPTTLEVIRNDGHPLSWIHGEYKDPYLVTRYGEALGLGESEYELVDVLPVGEPARVEANYISAN
ncbi:MAG TPA: DUF362 domain-containing protein [Anaerolineaceae bacterium]|jgi:hypothetical protein